MKVLTLPRVKQPTTTGVMKPKHATVVLQKPKATPETKQKLSQYCEMKQQVCSYLLCLSALFYTAPIKIS